jgi:hypothetical protein
MNFQSELAMRILSGCDRYTQTLSRSSSRLVLESSMCWIVKDAARSTELRCEIKE